MSPIIGYILTFIGTIISVIVGVLIAPKINEKFKLRGIYLAPFRKWCAETYGELDEFYKRYFIGEKLGRLPKDYLLLILDYRDLHETLRYAPQWIGKIRKDKKATGEKFWMLMNKVDKSWHRLGQDFRHSLPAVDDVKIFEEHIKNSLSDVEQKKIATKIWKDMKALSRDDIAKILDFLYKRLPK